MITVTLIDVIMLLGLHWFADFVLQSDRVAKGKSKSFHVLSEHALIYSTAMTMGISLILYVVHGVVGLDLLYRANVFFFVTVVAHWVTDAITSRINSALWQRGDVHNFFVSVGMDQYLHQLQLLATWMFLDVGV